MRFIILLSLFVFALPLAAQTGKQPHGIPVRPKYLTTPCDPSTINLRGVTLGQTPEEVATILQATANSKFMFVKPKTAAFDGVNNVIVAFRNQKSARVSFIYAKHTSFKEGGVVELSKLLSTTWKFHESRWRPAKEKGALTAECGDTIVTAYLTNNAPRVRLESKAKLEADEVFAEKNELKKAEENQEVLKAEPFKP